MHNVIGSFIVHFTMLRRFKMLIITAGAFAILLTVSGCNTVQGFGKDLQKLGGKLEDTADRS